VPKGLPGGLRHENLRVNGDAVKFGVAFAFQHYGDWDRFLAGERGEKVGPPTPEDYEIWSEQVALAELVEPLGFDALWTMEQHAAPYLMVCDPTQFLTYFAARTKRIDFGSMITVLPWHNPMRLAEQLVLLQYVMGRGRRYYLGIGRGLARRNFSAMGVEMATSRERFNEVLDVLQLAFTQEFFSYEGQFFKYDNVSLRPRPLDPNLVIDAYAAWTTETSMRHFAERGLHPLTTLNRTMEVYTQELEVFYQVREGAGHGVGERPIFEAPLYCCESHAEAEEGAEQFFREYIDSVIKIYEVGSEGFGKQKGYEDYRTKGSQFGDGTAESAMETLTTKLIRDAIWGTPDECAERIVSLTEQVNPQQFVVLLGLGSMSGPQMEKSLRLYADKVMPQIAHLRDKEAVPA
jgi:alkanesulfonate monooxygenase SsuD/methylene tetrahydromethanopterin reductase-like flavin-dependent oxidoreductase (luciferase family)